MKSSYMFGLTSQYPEVGQSAFLEAGINLELGNHYSKLLMTCVFG